MDDGAESYLHASPANGFVTHCRCRTRSLLQNYRAIRGPAQVPLVAPIDGPLRRALIVLCENRDDLAGFRLDAIRRTIAEVAQFPNHPLDLIDPVAADGLLAQADLLRAQGHPDTLPAAETSQLIDDQVAPGLG